MSCLLEGHFSLFEGYVCLLGGHICLFEAHACLLEGHFCLFEGHVCLLEGHFCLLEGHVCLLEGHVCSKVKSLTQKVMSVCLKIMSAQRSCLLPRRSWLSAFFTLMVYGDKVLIIVFCVFSAPVFVVGMSSKEEIAAVGATQRFECQVIGFPTPSISWFKDEIDITENPRYNIGYDKERGVITLTIKEVHPSDEGCYQCRAQNTEGYATTTAYLVVRGQSLLVL